MGGTDHEWAVDFLLDLYRPDRYVVDATGWAPWMAQVDTAVAEMVDGLTPAERLRWVITTTADHLVGLAADTGRVHRDDRTGLVAVPAHLAIGDHGTYRTTYTCPGRPDVHLCQGAP